MPSTLSCEGTIWVIEALKEQVIADLLWEKSAWSCLCMSTINYSLSRSSDAYSMQVCTQPEPAFLEAT